MKAIEKVDLTWSGNKDLSFNASQNCNEQNAKELLLHSLGLCTGMTLISLLLKMRLNVEELKIEVIGELSDNPPTAFSTFVNFTQKIEIKTSDNESSFGRYAHATAITHDRYCGVTLMLEKVAPVVINLFVNDTQVDIKENK